MEEEKYQKELFELPQSKKPFSRFSDILPKADLEGRVTIAISLEKLIFISIGIIMVTVMVYALGVEAGRSSRKGSDIKEAIPQQAVLVPQNRTATIPARNILNTAPVVTPAAAVYQGSRPQTILACTFAKRENAENARAILTRQGFNVTVMYSQPYYRVLVGTYTDKTAGDSQRDLIRVRRIFKDAKLKLM